MLFGCELKKLLRYVILFAILVYAIALYFPDYSGPPVKQVTGWEFNVSRDIKLYVVPENITSVISGKELCQNPSVSTLIIVSSAPENVAQRYAIRQTWAMHNQSDVRVGFLLGWTHNITMQLQIEEESEEFHDVIQENFIDSYNNLTIKSVMMLKWYLHNCPFSTFLMKTDDDVYVNVTNLQSLLKSLKYADVLLGSLICRAKPIYDTRSKWYSPKYMYKKTFFPNYLSGTGYVMSKKTARRLFDTALGIPVIHLEDVYLTGICAAKAGVKPRNHGGFTYLNLGPKCIEGMITNHKLTPQEFHIAWANRNNCTIKLKPHGTIKTQIISGCN